MCALAGCFILSTLLRLYPYAAVAPPFGGNQRLVFVVPGQQQACFGHWMWLAVLRLFAAFIVQSFPWIFHGAWSVPKFQSIASLPSTYTGSALFNLGVYEEI